LDGNTYAAPQQVAFEVPRTGKPVRNVRRNTRANRCHDTFEPASNESRYGEESSALHELRLAAVTDELARCGARSVLDLGCGDGKLIERLAAQPLLTRIVGLDISPDAIAAARLRLGLGLRLGPDSHEQRIIVTQGSFMESNCALSGVLSGFDAAVLLETIEHIDPERLSLVERTVFGTLRPANVFVTTPNQEYNRLHGLSPGARRHPDHRFEWKRSKFRDWALGVAARNGYLARFRDIGDYDLIFGSSTQMACFVRQ
jgi:3' terminal RNA ribose 2'-O-methyltransferase Hen1